MTRFVKDCYVCDSAQFVVGLSYRCSAIAVDPSTVAVLTAGPRGWVPHEYDDAERSRRATRRT